LPTSTLQRKRTSGRPLERLGLAQERQQGVWQLDGKLESKLRRLGDRADKFRTMRQVLKELGIDRGAAAMALFERGPRKTPLIGPSRVMWTLDRGRTLCPGGGEHKDRVAKPTSPGRPARLPAGLVQQGETPPSTTASIVASEPSRAARNKGKHTGPTAAAARSRMVHPG
jgi:Protein of unknown function (DUF3363)